MSQQQIEFLSIAGRWRKHVAAAKLDTVLPKREQALAMLMFYAGFSAALDAAQEVAMFSEDEAISLLTKLSEEVLTVEAIAGRVLGGQAVS